VIVTGIGSLPHGAAEDAARFVLATTDLPYLPQLPARHPEEGMLRQWGDGMCGCGAADGGIGLRYGIEEGPRHEAFGGASAVLALHRSGELKTQITGPVTMAIALSAAGHPEEGLWDCVLAQLLRRLEDHLIWIASTSDSTAGQVHVVVDEPALVAFGPAAYRVAFRSDAESVLRAFFAAAPVPLGLHCCAETDWGLVASLRPAVISWDIETLSGGFAGEEAIAEAIAAGSGVAWGVVPTRPGAVPDMGAARARYGTTVARLVIAGAPVESLTRDSWVTPACGLAGLTEEGAAVVAARVREFAGDDGV
jgi:methionine synthase II (cobalamin-independent)